MSLDICLSNKTITYIQYKKLHWYWYWYMDSVLIKKATVAYNIFVDRVDDHCWLKLNCKISNLIHELYINVGLQIIIFHSKLINLTIFSLMTWLWLAKNDALALWYSTFAQKWYLSSQYFYHNGVSYNLSPFTFSFAGMFVAVCFVCSESL